MEVEFDKSFEKSIKKLKAPSILQRVENAIIQLEKAEKL